MREKARPCPTTAAPPLSTIVPDGTHPAVRSSYTYIDAGEYVPTAKTPVGPRPPSGKARALGTPLCPSRLLLVLPSRAMHPSRPGTLVSNTAMVLSDLNPVPYTLDPHDENATTVGPSMASTELYGRYDARSAEVYASIRCIGVDGPRQVAYTAVDGSAEDMRGYHA